jgi:hypothetical protein
MTDSRRLRHSPVGLFELQTHMARELRGAQTSYAQLKRESEAIGGKSEDYRKGERRALHTARRLAYIIKQTADGIAWRSFKYDRSRLHALWMKPSPGHLNLEGTTAELRDLGTHVYRTGHIGILNDLTNVLRHGDWTCIRPDGSIGVAEVKAGRGSAKSGRATRQRQRSDAIFSFCNEGVGVTEHGLTAIFDHEKQASTHLGTVAELLVEARARGAAHARLSDCLAVDILHMDALAVEGRRPLTSNPFSESQHCQTSSNLTFFDEFSTIVAPYSIFPFSDQDCFDLMTGAMWIVSYFNHDKLRRMFMRRGLRAQWPTNQFFAWFAEQPPAMKRRHRDGLGIRLSRPNSPATLTIGGGELARLIYEFTEEESFIDSAVETLDRWQEVRTPRALISSYPNEATIWD